MNQYNYRAVVRKDVLQFIMDNGIEVSYRNFQEKQNLLDKLEKMMWESDKVTGNPNGSYTLDKWQAEENLCHNLDLLLEALKEFGATNLNELENGAEWCDLTIRCYLLHDVLNEVLPQLAEGGNQK